jgi:FSR family fosmidomycin resistance protein-like MFS transporter
MGGVGAAVLGEVADLTSVELVYRLCAFLPAIGLVTWLLPEIESSSRPRAA